MKTQTKLKQNKKQKFYLKEIFDSIKAKEEDLSGKFHPMINQLEFVLAIYPQITQDRKVKYLPGFEIAYLSRKNINSFVGQKLEAILIENEKIRAVIYLNDKERGFLSLREKDKDVLKNQTYLDIKEKTYSLEYNKVTKEREFSVSEEDIRKIEDFMKNLLKYHEKTNKNL